MPVTLITAPTVEPVTVDEVKAHTSVEHSADDTLLGTYIKAARLHGENLTGRQFVAATWELVLDDFPANSGHLVLPKPPLQSVTSVVYYDTDNVQQTLVEGTDYVVSTDHEPGRVYLAPDQTWPPTYDRFDAVRVRYVTGWPLDGGDPTTPEDIKAWLMVRVSDLYEFRETLTPGRLNDLPGRFIDRLLDRWTIPVVV